jgi:hypothetical protein
MLYRFCFRVALTRPLRSRLVAPSGGWGMSAIPPLSGDKQTPASGAQMTRVTRSGQNLLKHDRQCLRQQIGHRIQTIPEASRLVQKP